MSDPVPVSVVDANVLLRFLLDDHPELSGKAAAILERMERGGEVLHCDPVTLAEVVWVLGSFYKQPNDAIARALEPILKAEGLRMPEKARYIRALGLFAHTVASFGDACACAAALEDCQGRLYSFDRKLSEVDGVDRRERPD
ncbi:MAG TPA: PIN domain-containing protein [Armatimonadota bacterium]|nr:PIN domain-containing protein [Armatimonadota bacterium]